MKGKQSGQIRIGTSGWHYMHWRGPFYPADLSPDGFLKYYAGYFPTVEINNTFYRLPDTKAFDSWRNIVPAGFIFAAKASRFITHVKKLKEPETAVLNFLERARKLEAKLGPILFQMPPGWNINIEHLESLLKILPSDCRYTFEFRDTSWFDDRINHLLAEYNAAFCIYDFAGTRSPQMVTGDFVYIRLHGPEKAAYTGRYTDDVLDGWAKFINDMSENGKDVYCYFDNDEAGNAVQDALKLTARITLDFKL